MIQLGGGFPFQQNSVVGLRLSAEVFQFDSRLDNQCCHNERNDNDGDAQIGFGFGVKTSRIEHGFSSSSVKINDSG